MNTSLTRRPANTLNGPAHGSYRTPDGKAQIDWRLESRENGLEFSATGDYDGGSGQCLDSIARAYPDDPMIKRIVAVWGQWHLNGMSAGTPEQNAALAEEKEKAVGQALALPNPGRFFYSLERRELNPHTLGAVAGLKDSDYYSWACHVLKARGLYRVRIPLDTPLKMTGGFDRLPKSDYQAGGAGWFYDYGQGWIYRQIPDSVLAEIHSWSDAPQPAGTLAESQAAGFLERFGLALTVKLSNTKGAGWQPAGHHYVVTIQRNKRPSPRLQFDFWGSANDKAEGKTPRADSILSCIASDINTPDTFEAYCDEFGACDDRTAFKTWKKADVFACDLREFFSQAEREALSEL